ncbi:MAG: response regulator [Chitinophagaceae bacterium]|nr:MAG: response regulator [Chitinophagaceae bacterium]
MKTVLITEDDPAIMDALQLVFVRNGYRVMTYANGSALLNDHFDKPDLFLIDRQLSGVDGLDICRHLKSNPETSSIPVIIFSASPHVLNHAIAAGADDFIEKPFSNKAVLELIARHMPK